MELHTEQEVVLLSFEFGSVFVRRAEFDAGAELERSSRPRVGRGLDEDRDAAAGAVFDRIWCIVVRDEENRDHPVHALALSIQSKLASYFASILLMTLIVENMFKRLAIVGEEGSVTTGPQEKRWVGVDEEERKEGEE